MYILTGFVTFYFAYFQVLINYNVFRFQVCHSGLEYQGRAKDFGLLVLVAGIRFKMPQTDSVRQRSHLNTLALLVHPGMTTNVYCFKKKT